MRKLLTYFSENYKKFLLVLLLAPAVWLVDQMEFPKVDAFIRDSLQFLNSPDEVDKRIVTVNVDTFSGNQKKPFPAKFLIEKINFIESVGARSIVLLFEPSEIDNPADLFEYLNKKSNIFVDNQPDRNNFFDKAYSKNYSNFIEFDTTTDSILGAMDRKSRRAMLQYKDRGPSPTYSSIMRLELNPIKIDDFKFAFDLWETKQAYFKTFKNSAFGYIDVNNIKKADVAGKVILLGSFDEWSNLANPSVFDILGKVGGANFKTNYSPYQTKVANLINFFTTGNYIKLVPVSDAYLIAILLLILIFAKTSPKRKVLILISVVPVCCALVVVVFVISNFYIDLSRTVGSFFIFQYLALPFMLYVIFKQEELKKAKDINTTRIDSLLLVSEKVAHDIRSPLSAINLMLSRAKFESDEERLIVTSSLKRIDDSAEKILLKYKTSTGINYENLEIFDVYLAVQTIVEEKKIIASSVKFTVQKIETAHAKGHKLEFERILSNILDNSIHATSQSDLPSINVQLSKTDRFLVVTVSDNGHGISENILKLLGTKPVSSKREPFLGVGHGIGLLHAKRILERMNGDLQIESVEGTGTIVTLELTL